MCIITIDSGHKIKIDKEDVLLLEGYTWRYRHKRADKYYIQRHCRTGENYLHRLIMKCSKGMTVDHINGDTLDNRKCNLRICSQADNLLNKYKKSDDTTSKYIGVHHHPGKQKQWRAQIQRGKTRIHVGMFNTPEEAALARDKVAQELHGEYARLNFPEKVG